MTTKLELNSGISVYNVSAGVEVADQGPHKTIIIPNDGIVRIGSERGANYLVRDGGQLNKATVFENAPRKRFLFSVWGDSISRRDGQKGKILFSPDWKPLGRVLYLGRSK